MSEGDFSRLAAALREHDVVVAAWLDHYVASTVRVPRPVERGGLAQTVAPIVEALGDALAQSPVPGGPPGVAQLAAGSADMREVEKAVALVGAGMASAEASGFDVAALMLGLKRALSGLVTDEARRQTDAFCEWLAAVALDAFAGARVAAERERWRAELEDGTPVLQVAPDVPAVFLIGRPDGRLLDALFARLLLLVVRVGARTVVIDASGLGDPGHLAVLGAFERFVSHPKMAGQVHVILVGLDGEVDEAWLAVSRARGIHVTTDTHFDRAVAEALAAAGHRLRT